MHKLTDKNTSFQPDVDPLLLKNLIQKSDMLGLLHFAIYFIILILLGCLSFVLLGSTWFFPAFLLYAIVFAFSEAAAHELTMTRYSEQNGLMLPRIGWYVFYRGESRYTVNTGI